MLLVDDHRQVLHMVSAILASDFYVVGLATDGRQALEMARRVDPDVIVLDVDLPGMDGFQAMRALAQGGLATTPVVFVSAHAADDIVGEAFRCGGRGYVVESRVRDDLATALDQALLGRLFVPSPAALFRRGLSGGHAMHVHAGGASMLDELAAFFDRALQHGDATCVIATERVRDGLAPRLRARGWDVSGLSGHPRYRALDAAEVLTRCMHNGRPDADRLAAIAAELDQYRRAVAESAASRLTIFGEMVMLLGEAGNAQAVLELERLWNTLTQGLPFLTLCGYSTSCFHTRVPQLWSDVCTAHGTLSHASDV